MKEVFNAAFIGKLFDSMGNNRKKLKKTDYDFVDAASIYCKVKEK